MGKDKKESKLKSLNEKLQPVIKLVGAIVFLTPLIWTGIKKSVPYFQFVVKGPELVSNVEELKRSLLTITGAFADNSISIDSTEIYVATWRNHKYKARLKRMKTKDVYVFLKDGEMGETSFLAIYHHGTNTWNFIDHDGVWITLENGQ